MLPVSMLRNISKLEKVWLASLFIGTSQLKLNSTRIFMLECMHYQCLLTDYNGMMVV